MSLYGYKPKGKKAPWTTTPAAIAAATALKHGADAAVSRSGTTRQNGAGITRRSWLRSKPKPSAVSLNRTVPVASSKSHVPQKSWTRIAPVSKRSLPRRRQYTVDARAWKLRNPLCQCCRLIFKRKPQPTTSVHHSRGRASTLLLDQRFWKAACDECHDWIHQNPSLAQSLGLFCAMGKWNSPPKHGYCDSCGCRTSELLCGACLTEKR